jgi:hypothetical protein
MFGVAKDIMMKKPMRLQLALKTFRKKCRNMICCWVEKAVEA